MAGTRFQVKSYGANLVARHIDGVALNAQDLRPAKPAVARRVAAGYARSFDRQGPGWTPLKRSTERKRIAEGYSPGPILVKTGKYRRMATTPGLLIVDETGDGFTIRVNYDISGVHQAGSKNMKSRPLRLSFGDRTALVREISDHVHSGYGRP